MHLQSISWFTERQQVWHELLAGSPLQAARHGVPGFGASHASARRRPASVGAAEGSEDGAEEGVDDGAEEGDVDGEAVTGEDVDGDAVTGEDVDGDAVTGESVGLVVGDDVGELVTSGERALQTVLIE